MKKIIIVIDNLCTLYLERDCLEADRYEVTTVHDDVIKENDINKGIS
jgi:hypothetical protein